MIPGIMAGQMRAAGGGGGGSISWLSATPTLPGSSATSHAVNVPAVTAGDLLVMHVVNFWSVDIATPAGWTAIGTTWASGTRRSAVFYQIAPSTAAATTVTITLGGSGQLAAIVQQIENGTFALGTPPERATAQTTTTTNPDSPTLSPSWGSAETLWVSSTGYSNGFGARTITVWPYVDGQTSAPSGGSGSSLPAMGACYVITPAATEDPGAYTLSGSVNGSVSETLAIRPA